tara:strand:+ start:1493 stop:2170 length:678 start_codon:yes stop_codon:yes gene_type:complete
MSTFLRLLLETKPVRTPLSFGVQDNVRLTNIHNDVVLKDGQPVERGCYLTFTQFGKVGEEVKAIKATQFFYFNLGQNDFTAQNLATQIGQLQNICDVLGADATIDPTGIFEEDMEAYLAGLKSKKVCDQMQDIIWEQFYAAVGDKVGMESPLLRLKVVTSSDGRFSQLPQDSVMAELMTDEKKLSITPYEMKRKRAALEAQTATADTAGSTPGEKSKNKAALALL